MRAVLPEPFVHTIDNPAPNRAAAPRALHWMERVPAKIGKLTLDAITPMKIEEFKATKLSAGLAPKSVNNSLTVLGKSLRTAEEWGELDRAPRTKLLRVPPQKFVEQRHSDGSALPLSDPSRFTQEQSDSARSAYGRSPPGAAG